MKIRFDSQATDWNAFGPVADLLRQSMPCGLMAFCCVFFCWEFYGMANHRRGRFPILDAVGNWPNRNRLTICRPAPTSPTTQTRPPPSSRPQTIGKTQKKKKTQLNKHPRNLMHARNFDKPQEKPIKPSKIRDNTNKTARPFTFQPRKPIQPQQNWNTNQKPENPVKSRKMS